MFAVTVRVISGTSSGRGFLLTPQILLPAAPRNICHLADIRGRLADRHVVRKDEYPQPTGADEVDRLERN
jgi:hypothetical protein